MAAELHFWQAPLAKALFSERCSSNTRPAHRCTLANALHLCVLRSKAALHNSSPYSPRVTALRVRVRLRHAPSCFAHIVRQALTLGPLSHRSSLCMFCADTRCPAYYACGYPICSALGLRAPVVATPSGSSISVVGRLQPYEPRVTYPGSTVDGSMSALPCCSSCLS